MIDPVLAALRDYEKSVAPAYEVIRRAKARLTAQLAGVESDPIPALYAWSNDADPTEPDGAELAVEASLIEQAASAGAAAPSVAVSGEAGARAASPIQTPHSDGHAGSPVSGAATAQVLASPPGDGPAPATPLLIACPTCSFEVKPQGLGSHMRKHKAGYQDRTPTRAGPRADCPECGKNVTAMGLGTHRRQAHGRGRKTVLVKPAPKPEPAPKRRGGQVECPTCKDWFVSEEKLLAHRRTSHGHRAGKQPESFLCDRCSRSFPNRQARDEHRATHTEPARGQPVGRDPTARRQAGGVVPVA